MRPRPTAASSAGPKGWAASASPRPFASLGSACHAATTRKAPIRTEAAARARTAARHTAQTRAERASGHTCRTEPPPDRPDREGERHGHEQQAPATATSYRPRDPCITTAVRASARPPCLSPQGTAAENATATADCGSVGGGVAGEAEPAPRVPGGDRGERRAGRLL